MTGPDQSEDKMMTKYSDRGLHVHDLKRQIVVDKNGYEFAHAETAKAATAIASAVNSHDALVAALEEAERFMAYFAHETDGIFVGPGTPATCLAQIRATLSQARA